MRLHSLFIEGFRKHSDTKIYFSDATFLIGENNVGKSSVLAALKYLLSDTKKIPMNEFLKDKDGKLAEEVIITAEFRNVPKEAENWRGFKGRLLQYDALGNTEESGLKIIYRKTFPIDSNYSVEMKSRKKIVKDEFKTCYTIDDYIKNGLNKDIVIELFGDEIDYNSKLGKKYRDKLEELDELYNYFDEEDWFKNPGGIPGNVLSKIPKFLLIPAQDKVEELGANKGTLYETLCELFDDVRKSSENYKKAQVYLEALAKELDPTEKESEFGKMMTGLNKVLDGVFPNTEILANATLSDADKSIKPLFEVSMQSNITTSVELQGTGMIRAAVFALLRYKMDRDLSREENIRPLIIGFEEPEIYLHPNAVEQMRDTIYDLASSENNQIVCTTHSPYMIDISRNPAQMLNRLSMRNCEYMSKSVESVEVNTFNTSKSFKNLQEDDRTYVKMILKIDDNISRVFFSKRVLIIEGDTEELVLKETIRRMPLETRKKVQSEVQIIKARGKATIISLVKYLKSMGINPTVIHDSDLGTAGAEKFNRPILEAVGDDNKVYSMENCIEDVLGYKPPNSNKPYKAYKYILESWSDEWESIDKNWREVLENIFAEEFKLACNYN
nr:AAA family ATPase [Clostridioides sp.]